MWSFLRRIDSISILLRPGLGILNKFLSRQDQDESRIQYMLRIDKTQTSLSGNVNFKNYVRYVDKNPRVIWYHYPYMRPKWLYIVASFKHLRSWPSLVWRDFFQMFTNVCHHGRSLHSTVNEIHHSGIVAAQYSI